MVKTQSITLLDWKYGTSGTITFGINGCEVTRPMNEPQCREAFRLLQPLAEEVFGNFKSEIIKQ